MLLQQARARERPAAGTGAAAGGAAAAAGAAVARGRRRGRGRGRARAAAAAPPPAEPRRPAAEAKEEEPIFLARPPRAPDRTALDRRDDLDHQQMRRFMSSSSRTAPCPWPSPRRSTASS